MACASITDLFEAYRSAVERKDLASLLDLYDTDLSAFDTWDAWVYANPGDWRRMNEQWLLSTGEDRDVVTIADVGTHASGDLGAATAIVTYSATSPDGRVLRSMQTRLTWLTRKSAGQWKVFHQHTSVPVSSSSLSALLQMERR